MAWLSGSMSHRKYSRYIVFETLMHYIFHTFIKAVSQNNFNYALNIFLSKDAIITESKEEQ